MSSRHPLSQPWAISEQGLQLVLSVWSRGDMFADVLADARTRRARALDDTSTPTNPAPGPLVGYEVREGVALIPVTGPLFRHASMLTDVSGATSYERIRRDLSHALANAAVSRILLVIDSPGGEVAGCGELASEIRAACAVKDVVAYAEGTCASAAYWLASAASRIVVAPTAMIGSIGVRIACVDDAAKQEKDGVRRVEIISSQSPGKRFEPMNAEVIERMQQHADDIAAVFIGDVAKYRGVTPAKVASLFGGGDVLIAAKAVAGGSADEIGSLTTFFPNPAPAPPQPNGVQTMKINTNPGGSPLAADKSKDTKVLDDLAEQLVDRDESEDEKEESGEPDGDEAEVGAEDEDEEKAALRATVAALSAKVSALSAAAPVSRESAEAWTDRQIKAGYPGTERATLLKLRQTKPNAADKAAFAVLKACASLKRSQRLTAGGAPVGTSEERAASTARGAGGVSADDAVRIKAHAAALLRG